MFEWHRRAKESIAQGSLTNSKRPEILIKGVSPTHCTHGQGAFLYAPDRKRYIDFICGLGTNLFGYAHPSIVKAISAQLNKGWLYSLGSTTEVEVAEKLKEVVPFCTKFRFVKSGTEACIAAVRIACAHTDRKKVLSTGYHGWGDGFVSLTQPALGVTPQPSFENFTSLAQINTGVACLILEPIVTDWSDARLKWLDEVLDKCKKNGVLVIFDEIITGFRWPQYTFAKWSGRRPDIICLGKACASGLPLGIVGLAPGIGDDKEWFVSGTYGGELLSLCVLQETMNLLRNKFSLDELWREGGYFMQEFNALWPEKLRLEGYPTRGIFVGDPNVKALFWQECAKAGILFGPSWFFGFQHIELRHAVVNSAKDILTKIKNNEVKLEGDMPQSPFAQRVRESA